MNKKIHPEISIIIVNYNSSDLLSGCIESILSHIHIDFEIIVYDNASSDGSADRTAHPLLNNSRVKILLDPENIGFAIANNRAAKVAKGKYLHFLNPDTIIDSDLNADYEHLLANEQRAVFVTGLREGDGKIRKMKHLIPTIGNYFNALFLKQKAAYWNIGASIITDRSTFNGIGGWPEDYFMYAEDLDFFYIIN
ncbi:MAG: glycosyltransferase [Bacteroidetes bacterium]|nr:glycosyltransferase [Bacteroidota bacterium]